MHKSLANIRNEYKKSTLSRKNVKTNPIDQFLSWFEEARAAEVLEYTAMTLATANAKGQPSLRVVLLKSIEDGKFTFYTNYQSQKGKELAENPQAALSFFWPELERQIRIEGVVERVDEQTATTYFQSRPRESQVGAWASPQSAVVESRELLEKRKKQIEERFAGATVLPKPKQWGGFALKPHLVEFWQGRAGRLHDRILYTISDDNEWKINRLAP